MTNKMTFEKLLAAEKEGKAERIKSWHNKDNSHVLFKYGNSLYHHYSTIFASDGNGCTSKLSTKNPDDIEKDFSNVYEFEDF